MQFLISVIDLSAGLQTDAERAAIEAFDARLRDDGIRLFVAGLAAPDEAIVIDNRGDAPIVTDGTVDHGEEFTAGFWIIDVPDEATAKALATEASKHCNRKVELRALR